MQAFKSSLQGRQGPRNLSKPRWGKAKTNCVKLSGGEVCQKVQRTIEKKSTMSCQHSFSRFIEQGEAAVVCDNINQALYLAGFSFFVSPQNIKLGTFFPRYAAPKNCPLIDLSARDKVALQRRKLFDRDLTCFVAQRNQDKQEIIAAIFQQPFPESVRGQLTHLTRVFLTSHFCFAFVSLRGTINMCFIVGYS